MAKVTAKPSGFARADRDHPACGPYHCRHLDAADGPSDRPPRPLPRPRPARAGPALRRIHAEVRPRKPVFLQCRPLRLAAPRWPSWRRATPTRIDEAGVDFDVLFGPAYKGIPLATALACEYARRGRDLPLAFNRKEAKAHGEGGLLIGAPLAGKRVLIVDDVITAGTAIREALGIIRDVGGMPAGIVIALDRQERASEAHAQSAAQAVAAEHALPVVAVATLADLLAFAGESADLVDHRDALLAYRARYGSATAP